MTRIHRWLLWFILAILVILNLVPWSSSLVFEQQHFPEAFGRSWGWPFSACAAANDQGITLIDASVVFHGSRVVRGVFSGQHPHLAVNLPIAIVNSVAVMVILLAAFVTATLAGGDGQSRMTSGMTSTITLVPSGQSAGAGNSKGEGIESGSRAS